MRTVVGGVLAAGLLCSPAWSQTVEIGQPVQGAVYYSRPGATLADHNREFEECLQMVATYGDNNQYGTMTDSVVFHLIWDGPAAGLAAARAENCMIVRGWRAVRIPESEAADVLAKPPTARSAIMEPWIGAQVPHGEVVREFANEAEHPAHYTTASRPSRPSKSHISLALYADSHPSPPKLRVGPAPRPTLDAKWPLRSLKPSDLGAAPPGSALIVLRVTGISNHWGTGVVFQREGSDPGDRPSFRDHAPDMLAGATGILFGKKDGNWFVLAVPPGRWRIASSGFVDYCLGAPSFQIDAGEVVYAGTFHLEGDSLGPDLDVSAAKTYLANTSAADHVRLAVYRNGSRAECNGISLSYALEFPGAPFAQDYAWGSARTGETAVRSAVKQ